MRKRRRSVEVLEAMPSDTPEQVAAKAALYAEAEEAVVKLKAASDALVVTELAGLNGRKYEEALEAAADRVMLNWARGIEELKAHSTELLGPHRTLHWPLVFPEIMDRGGFDAFVGNPPFVGGQKITGNFGADYRDLLVIALAKRKKGSADLCAYFFLRAVSLLRQTCHMGLVATNTIAQGDTREVGLAQLVPAEGIITRAISSNTWPGAATVFYAAVWLCRGDWKGGFVLDGVPARGITASLRPETAVAGKPFRLSANERLSFHGSCVLGLGFVLTPSEANTLIESDPQNAEVVLPYIVGEDLNSHPQQRFKRWVICFFDWPLNRQLAPESYKGPVAEDYPGPLAIVRNLVKGERESKRENNATALDRANRWWLFGRYGKDLYQSITGMQRVLAVSLITNHVSFAFAPSNWIFAHKLAVFPLDSSCHFALLQSSLHYWWAWEHCSTNLSLLNYSHSDCFETFPFPSALASLNDIGLRYNKFRSEIMADREMGLTPLYNKFHNPREESADLTLLRALHLEMDQAVAAAYGWSDFDLGHGFHETKQGKRYTVSETARREILDRLLALNHQRHAEEKAEEMVIGKQPKTTGKRGRKAKAQDPHDGNTLFSEVGDAK